MAAGKYRQTRREISQFMVGTSTGGLRDVIESGAQGKQYLLSGSLSQRHGLERGHHLIFKP